MHILIAHSCNIIAITEHCTYNQRSKITVSPKLAFHSSNYLSILPAHILFMDSVGPSTSNWEYICDFEVEYGSKEYASIVQTSLEVDKELQPDKVKRLISVSDSKLIVHLEAAEARFLRASYSSLVDLIVLATQLIEEFGQTSPL